MNLEEFDGWLGMRETREVKDYLVELRDNYREQIHNLLTQCNDPSTINIQAVRLQGMIVGINALLEMEWTDVGGTDDV